MLLHAMLNIQRLISTIRDGEHYCAGTTKKEKMVIIVPNKLKPCPFCGGEVHTYVAKQNSWGSPYNIWMVNCPNCWLNYPIKTQCFTEEEAINIWNKRCV